MKLKDEIRGLLYNSQEVIKKMGFRKRRNKDDSQTIITSHEKIINRLAVIDLETGARHQTNITSKVNESIEDMLWHDGGLWIATDKRVYNPDSEREIKCSAQHFVTLDKKLYAHNHEEIFDVNTGDIKIDKKDCKSAGILSILAVVPYKKGLLALATTPYEKHGGDYNTLEYFFIEKGKTAWSIDHLAQHPGSEKRDFPFWHDVGPQHRPLMINVNGFILSTSGWCYGKVFVQKDVTKEPVNKLKLTDCARFFAYDKTRKRLFAKVLGPPNYCIYDLTINRRTLSMGKTCERFDDNFSYDETKGITSFLYITKSQMDELLRKRAQNPVQEELW